SLTGGWGGTTIMGVLGAFSAKSPLGPGHWSMSCTQSKPVKPHSEANAAKLGGVNEANMEIGFPSKHFLAIVGTTFKNSKHLPFWWAAGPSQFASWGRVLHNAGQPGKRRRALLESNP